MTIQVSLPEKLNTYWGVCCARIPAGELTHLVTWRDMDVDAFWARRCIIPAMEIAAGSLVHFTHNYSEEYLFWPLYQAVRQVGGTFATGMATPWDAYRIEMYLRRFHLQAAIGIAPATLDGLAQSGLDPIEVIGRARVVAALPGAYERLVAAGLKPWRIVPLGPACAYEAPDGAGARYNAGEWELESRAGRIFLSASPRRRLDETLVGIDTGVDGIIRTIATPGGSELRLFVT
jgi:hypothetical protein